MKKLLFMAAILFTAGMNAQEKPAGKQNAQHEKMMATDHVMMQDGKMWLIKDGKSTAMDKDVTLADGTVVTSMGKVTNKNNASVTLENGQMIGLDGKWLPSASGEIKEKAAKDKEKKSKM